MAGIGFELKRAFQKKGLFALIKAYGYSAMVCTGPMILGILLLLGIKFLGILAGTADGDMRLVNSMVTYTLLASLLTTNVLSMVTTRYIADQLYMKRPGSIMPSFYGSISVMLVAGGAVYGTFLIFSGLDLRKGIACFVFYGILIVVWTEINYLTAVKNYRGILLAFLGAVIITFVTGYLLIFVLKWFDIIISMMIAVCVGYGAVSIIYYAVLLRYFPKGDCSSLYFLKWIDQYRELVPIGTNIGIGLYSHLIIMWASPASVQVKGLFYEAPMYDISALMAFLSILITTVNFVTSVEVEFYPKYRDFFSLLDGALVDIEQAQKEMKQTLIRELTYTFIKQFFSSMLFIIVGSILIPMLPLGFSDEMLGIFRIMCCGYAFYAMGNSLMLIQLYFADNRGAMISTGAFMLVGTLGTVLTTFMGVKWYGFGFLAGGIVFTMLTFILLRNFMKEVLENILMRQPLKESEVRGPMKSIAEKYERKYQEKYPRRRTVKQEEEIN